MFAAASRYLASLRFREVLVLQAPPLFGVAVAHGDPLSIPVAPLAVLVVSNVLLMAHVFAVNDWSNAASDLADADKAAAVFTTRGVGRRGMAVFAAALLAAALLAALFLGTVPLLLCAGIALLSALYSLPLFDWKGRPWLSSAAHLVGGVLHFLYGYALGGGIDGRGVAVGVFCAVTFAGGHLVQELRDLPGDLRSAVRTNAVVFGARRVFAASLVCFSLSHLILLTLALTGMLPRPLALLAVLSVLHVRWSLEALRAGLTRAAVCRLQSRYRSLYALIGLLVALSLWMS